ncbi:transcriptional regulator, PadR-like family [Thermincola ferriacetica]|uniref:Transcriptional regulator, PadR-like family n=1 Tax=Thermincola ferriacetica TaxID=281456 RepID=A0A0L6W134_9FIRM|nr:PadR family transcriptional regulator [Thermincola ferriacetica]KNZ69292.1 transcriptional regulator, PadR-like family [Thermincola ferriacetica]
MPKCRYGRHIPAFVLLFLAQEPAYGLTLFNKMEEQMPHNRADSAAVYRALQELEKMGAVESYWDTSEPGPAKKWYKITRLGRKKLVEFKEDIEMKKKNLEFFLTTFAALPAVDDNDE